MANLGFRQAMERRQIRVHETPVGDRNVLAALESRGWTLGGEQSGHVIFRDMATTGDGLLTGVQLLDVVSRSGITLGDLATGAMTRLPQVLHNVAVTGDAAQVVASLEPKLTELKRELGDGGRILVRPSGYGAPDPRDGRGHERGRCQGHGGQDRLVDLTPTFTIGDQIPRRSSCAALLR